MRFRKRPLEVDAIQYTGDLIEIADWVAQWHDEDDDSGIWMTGGRGKNLSIDTLEGVMTVSPGDWIIRGSAGEFYPCKPGIFEQSYRAVEAGW